MKIKLRKVLPRLLALFLILSMLLTPNVMNEIKEGKHNTGEKWEKDTVYGKVGAYNMFSWYWIPVLIFGSWLVCTVIHFEDFIFTVSNIKYSTYMYLAIKVCISVVLLMDFCIRTKKLYFAIIWNVTATTFCKYLIVMNYIIIFGLLYEPFVWLVVWGWSVELILREMGALIPVSLITYVINEIMINISFKRHLIEYKEYVEKNKNDYK